MPSVTAFSSSCVQSFAFQITKNRKPFTRSSSWKVLIGFIPLACKSPSIFVRLKCGDLKSRFYFLHKNLWISCLRITSFSKVFNLPKIVAMVCEMSRAVVGWNPNKKLSKHTATLTFDAIHCRETNIGQIQWELAHALCLRCDWYLRDTSAGLTGDVLLSIYRCFWLHPISLLRIPRF